MNKQEMIKAMSVENGLTQVDNVKAFNALEKITLETVAKGEKVQLTGFVTIKPVYRAARKGFDPIKQEPIDIASTVGISVKAGEKLRKSTLGLVVADFAPVVAEVVAE